MMAAVVSSCSPPCSETGICSGTMPQQRERMPCRSSPSSSAGMLRGSVVMIAKRFAIAIAACAAASPMPITGARVSSRAASRAGSPKHAIR